MAVVELVTYDSGCKESIILTMCLGYLHCRLQKYTNQEVKTMTKEIKQFQLTGL